MAFRLSIAIPVHNEESVLPELLRRTLAVLDQIPDGPHELVFADDGSRDRTLPMLADAARQDPRILVISLSRNFGHQAALTAALDHVTGDATIVMDGDLQDVPEAIPQFVEQYWKGYDVVYAQRVRRKEAWPLRLCYFLFYRLLAKLSDIRQPLDAGDFGLLSRRVIEELHLMPEHHRYLRGLRSWVGFRQIGVAVERDQRHSGTSKYSATRLLKLASDGIFSFSIVPIRVAGMLGAASIFASAVYAVYSLYAKIFLHESPQGFTALIIVTTFLLGVVLLFLGVIGEYVGRIYEETKARPLYVVGQVLGGARGETADMPSGARLRREMMARSNFR
jgi:glycosyltransferase involved in cell wall biosynthesis